MISKGTAAVKKPIREKLIQELYKVGMPRYKKGQTNFVEHDTATFNLRQTVLHVRNKLAEYEQREINFT